MANKCDICGKTVHFGHRVSHSKQHTRRRWLPNIQRATVTLNGKPTQVNLCTQCLRSQHKLAH